MWKDSESMVAALARLEAATAEARQRLDALSAEVESVRAAASRIEEAIAALPSMRSESDNNFFRVINSIGSRSLELQSALFETRNAVLGEFQALNNVVLPELTGEIHASAATVLSSDERPVARGAARSRPQPRGSPTYAEALAKAEREFSSVYSAWKDRLDSIAAAFTRTKSGNAAHAADPYSRLFRAFVGRWARGQILDVGCGPFGLPYYLQGVPFGAVSGIDPLLSRPAEFSAVRGISEYLPWDDKVFDTVISATSLDHCLSLDRSIEELLRVLAPEGVVLLWVGSNPGAPEFRPPDLSGADQFHLFHFDIAWFEPMLERKFAILEKQQFRRSGYSHVFYSLARAPDPN